MAALLRAQDVAGPADFEVAHGDLEAGPQLGELLDGLQPPRRLRVDLTVPVQQQVRIRPVLVAAHAAPQLVQVGQPVVVRLVDEDGVGRRDVQPALDDRRRHQHVRLALDEAQHGLLQLALGHLPVRHHRPRLRHDLLELRLDGVDVQHPVVHEVDLTLAVQLAQDGVADELPVEADDARLDGQTVRRRRLQIADVADPQ